MKRHAVFVFSFLVPTFAALAQSTPPPVQTSDEIVVTASAVPETIGSTPATVTVVTKKQIDDRAARDVSEVLREVPGISVSRTGSFGKATSIFTRGSSSKQTLVLWNGIEINDPYFSGYNFGQFSTAGVERIEVARGPFSSLYGADAVGGVVNIITTGGHDQSHGRMDVDVAAGSHGLRNGVVSIAQSGFSATLEHRQDEGFAPNDNDMENAFIGGYTHKTQTLSIGLAGRYSNYNLGVPRNTNLFATAFIATPHHREDGKEWQLAVPVSLELGAVHLDARVSESHRDDHNEDPDAFTFGTTRSQRRGAHLAARISTAIGTLVGGAEEERAEAENKDSFGLDLDRRKRTSNAFFVEDRIAHDLGNGKLDLSLGLRYDHYQIFGSATSPRVAAAFSRQGHKFRAAYGKAFRAPQLGELYLPFFGNPDLKPERSRTFEAGYDRYFEHGSSLSVTYFDNDYRELIEYDLAASRFGNVGRASSRGLEVGATDQSGPWSFGLSYTYLKATDDATGEQLVRRPKHSGSLSVGYSEGAAGAELVIARVGSRVDVTDLFPFGNVTNSGYTKADLTLRWSTGGVVPYVKFENLTNSKYEEVFGYPSPRRRAIAGVRYTR